MIPRNMYYSSTQRPAARKAEQHQNRLQCIAELANSSRRADHFSVIQAMILACKRLLRYSTQLKKWL
ncbi:conserved hypothetical protein [Ricinus communis]|uniref:Uncharacterized protein n=1 Tax=Ricinus communis TaxID=3988 RepID=B9RCF7_RICCO|nr:conserved hypothetical protein [Ricinus communis]